jgi:predicted Ser/Thr protein kinase
MAKLLRGLWAAWKDYNGMRDVAEASIKRTAAVSHQHQQKRQELLTLLGRTESIKAQVVENGVKQLELGSLQSEHEVRLLQVRSPAESAVIRVPP